MYLVLSFKNGEKYVLGDIEKTIVNRNEYCFGMKDGSFKLYSKDDIINILPL